MRFPSCVRSLSSRTDTGQKILTVRSWWSSPRASRSRASAPPTPASTTSLTVQSNALLTALHRFERDAHVLDPAAAPDRAVDRQGRRDRIGGHQRADRPRELRRAVDDLARARQRRVARDRRAPPVAGSVRTRCRSPAAPGRARAPAAMSGASSTVGSREKSNIAVAMSIPEMPSVSVWCDLCTRPTWSPRSTPSTNQSSHSGWSRSRICSMSRSASEISWRRDPGAGSRVSFTWRAMSKSGSSTQIGRPSPNGTCSTRRRKRGMSDNRDSTSARTSSSRKRPSGP